MSFYAYSVSLNALILYFFAKIQPNVEFYSIVPSNIILSCIITSREEAMEFSHSSFCRQLLHWSHHPDGGVQRKISVLMLDGSLQCIVSLLSKHQASLSHKEVVQLQILYSCKFCTIANSVQLQILLYLDIALGYIRYISIETFGFTLLRRRKMDGSKSVDPA